MNLKSRIFMYAISSMTLVGCEQAESEDIMAALAFSGENRMHIEAVLNHFDQDSEKRDAVGYIVASMPFHHTSKGKRVCAYKECLKLFAEKGKDAAPQIDSLRQSMKRYPKNINDNDARSLDSVFLIKSLETAFRTREKYPWCKDLTEDEFRRYVLPYRVGNEELTFWRDSILKEYGSLADSLVTAGIKGRLEVANAILRRWNEKKFQWSSLLPSGPAVGLSNVYDKVGSCLEYAHGVVYLMRAFGIPSGIDMLPVCGGNNAAHFWPFIIDENGNTYAVNTNEPEWNKIETYGVRGGKVLRKEFGLNKSLLKGGENDVPRPPLFVYPLYDDVSRQYQASARQVKLSDIGVRGEPVYIAFTSGHRWIPVDMCMDGVNPSFDNIGKGFIAVVGVWRNGEIKPVTVPFEIPEEGDELRYINGSDETWEMTLFSKFGVTKDDSDLVYRSIGGVIEGSDDRSFSKCDTLWIIPELLRRKETYVNLPDDIPAYRYYRYKGADSTFCNIGELAFFRRGSDTAVRGNVIGTPGANPKNPDATFHKAFDGDHYTFFDYMKPSGGWTGMDFGNPIQICKVLIVPRNRDNYVRDGDKYELLYSTENGWKSAGIKISTSDSVNFVAPANRLYCLRNHSRGVDERIFEYDPQRRLQIFH